MSKDDKAKNAARDALLDGLNARNATKDLDAHADVDDSIMWLDLKDIEPYKYNPRSKPNPRYNEIKASIRADGITNMISVTRPPGVKTYSPYGGGNTRLQIAKELFAEGDMRFSRLMVKVKTWPGEAAVISAHLSENENRGDISFWEKAKGVAAFKREYEAEHGKPVSVGELAKELKKRGLSYGIKMIQNFEFAVEHLEPIGPWLKTDELNMVIRPSLAAYLELSNKLDKGDAVRKAIQDQLRIYGEDLEATELVNADLDPAERQPVALDVDDLLANLQSEVARALGFDQDRLTALAEALAQNPRLSMQDLLQARKPSPPSPKSSVPAPQPPASENGGMGPQRQLGPMLAPVPKSAGTQNLQTASASTSDESSGVSASAIDKAMERVHVAITALNELVPIHDFLVGCAELPLGYYVEIPQALDRLEGEELIEPIPALRQHLWVFLAMESGQFCAALAARIPVDPESNWTHAMKGGDAVMAAMCADRVRAQVSDGRLWTSSQEHLELLAHEQVGPIVNDLIAAFAALRACNPIQVDYRPLFYVEP
ncbi:ParB family protein [Corticibacter populi]|uniref:ParB family protein n=1 Tax=Corticibacter populi TaxID=1550736 RepID=UPI0010DCD098|nr:ParB family protein [Corticibacter populi]RZS35505.1 ParB family protein of integrating conjugative element (PFGI_1 class) [Corticibacter populi]